MKIVTEEKTKIPGKTESKKIVTEEKTKMPGKTVKEDSNRGESKDDLFLEICIFFRQYILRYIQFLKSCLLNFYSCGLSTATIEYSSLSVCLSVCLSVYTITQKIMVQLT